MATVKVKFRPSSLDDREGSLYYQIIHNRLPRQINTPYRILPSEWDGKKCEVIADSYGERAFHLASLRERIRCDLELLKRIIQRHEETTIPFTSDDIVEEFSRISSQHSLFKALQTAIGRLLNNGKKRTAETYVSTLHSFKAFNKGEDIMLDTIDSALMESYEAWLHKRNVTPNTASSTMNDYLKILIKYW